MGDIDTAKTHAVVPALAAGKAVAKRHGEQFIDVLVDPTAHQTMGAALTVGGVSGVLAIKRGAKKTGPQAERAQLAEQ